MIKAEYTYGNCQTNQLKLASELTCDSLLLFELLLRYANETLTNTLFLHMPHLILKRTLPNE